MNLRSILLPLLLNLALGSTMAGNDTSPALPTDEALRLAVIGTWRHEKNAGIATATIYTTYREDGIAIELIKVKLVFKKATGVWTKYQWRVEHGELRMTPLLSRSNTEDTNVSMGETVRQIMRVNQHEMLFSREGKERMDFAAEIPADGQKMIDELSKK